MGAPHSFCKRINFSVKECSSPSSKVTAVSEEFESRTSGGNNEIDFFVNGQC